MVNIECDGLGNKYLKINVDPIGVSKADNLTYDIAFVQQVVQKSAEVRRSRV